MVSPNERGYALRTSATNIPLANKNVFLQEILLLWSNFGLYGVTIFSNTILGGG